MARAEGNSWKVVAALVGRSERTIEAWPRMYSERWQAAMTVAAVRVLEEAGAEGVFKLRSLIRYADPKIALEAAKRLAQSRFDLAKIAARRAPPPPKPVPTEAQMIADFVEAHSREQLIKLGVNLLKARGPECLQIPGDEPAGAA